MAASVVTVEMETFEMVFSWNMHFCDLYGLPKSKWSNHIQKQTLKEKWNFPSRISLVNMENRKETTVLITFSKLIFKNKLYFSM